MYDHFKNYFHNDLVGFITNTADKPPFRMVVAGSYGIKSTLEDKHGIYGKIPRPSDIDITVSTYNSTMSMDQCFLYLSNKLTSFFKIHGITNFDMETVALSKTHVPVFNYNRKHLIMTKYKGEDFIDMAITDFKITRDMIDKPLSLKIGMPIKKEEYYLKEFLTLVYMENVPKVSPHMYKKRNPVVGAYPSKGKKDIVSSKLMCGFVKKKRYAKYCNLLRDLTSDALAKMTVPKREAYFSELNQIVK
jgi:hypothetical protein